MNLMKLSLALLVILLVCGPLSWLTGNLAGKALKDDSPGSANPTVVPSPTVVSSPTAEPTTAETTEEPSPTLKPTSTAAPTLTPTPVPTATPE